MRENITSHPRKDLEDLEGVPKEVLETIEPLTVGDFLRRIRRKKNELLKDIAARALPFAGKHFSTLDLGITHFGEFERGMRQLPEDLSYIIEGYQLTGDEIKQLQRAHELEMAIKKDDIKGTIELTNQEKVLNTLEARHGDKPYIFTANIEEHQKEKEKFEAMLNKLKPRLRRVLELRFGLENDGESHTFEQIAKILGITRERARQLSYKALQKLGISYSEALKVLGFTKIK